MDEDTDGQMVFGIVEGEHARLLAYVNGEPLLALVANAAKSSIAAQLS